MITTEFRLLGFLWTTFLQSNLICANIAFNSNVMKENVVRNKSFDFAVSVASYCKVLVSQKEFELSKQLLRAGTSIGANIREAGNAHSRREFLYRLTIALRECDETMFWLEVLRACKSMDEEKFKTLWSEAKDLFNILTRIIKTTRETTPVK